MDAELARSKFVGSMLGGGIGDALAVKVSFRMSPGAVTLSEGEVITYTDDTAMAIGVAESIAVKRCIDERHLGDRLRANYHREPGRGYGSGPPKVFAMVEQEGVTYSAAARLLFGMQGSMGNGAAMRIGPVGLYFHDSPELYELVRMSSVITHTHPVGIDGAALVAKAVAEAVRADPGKALDIAALVRRLEAFARTDELRTKMRMTGTLLAKKASARDAADELERGVRADESVPFALFSFLRNSRSFAECLECAIGNGGDRDTLGAMACTISGAFLGVEAIPARWRMALENREYIEKLSRLLLQIREKGLGGASPAT